MNVKNSTKRWWVSSVVCILLIVNSQESFSQPYLLLNKSSRKHATYYAGELISFQVRSDGNKITDRIIGFEDSLILFKDYSVRLKEISAIYVDSKIRQWYFLRYKYQTLLPILGGGYIILDVVNRGELDRQTLIGGGALICAGIIARFITPKTVKIKGNCKLSIVKR